MRFKVIGCGDAFGSGGRFNTCFMLTYGGEQVLIDCGASSLIALKRAGQNPDAIGTILITHLHGDHFGGLVFLLREATLIRRRSRKLTVAGPPGLKKRLRVSMEAFFPGGWEPKPDFGLEIVELEAGVRRELGPVAVTPFLVEHACGAPPFALRVEFGGRTVSYTGDTSWVDNLIAAGRGADLFVCEAYFFSKPINKHLSYEVVLARLADIAPKRLLLTHLNDDMLERVKDVQHEVAEDGLEIEL
ncbi:MBL fold metallo-hydrolase [Ramlibacter tataouinensis]|uniref:Ribonuclease Z (TRNA 3 endonuclease)-like protein n=1 Tax=Ramlibacter tataouinensis (strain ATCC BAA-407 / DSM 14655 / LMG 21543 / TTB310) TaxID=365046 RepID=F5XW27_RAMTT|nr:MBL fold metallo-hydrolase [Ramlibacter tataouinensis]AEG94130.1 ribonuclease Z (tRNA 3 endonuclease)-like protein [Ramlibacter tataouinensis TTB310]